MIKDKIHNKNL